MAKKIKATSKKASKDSAALVRDIFNKTLASVAKTTGRPMHLASEIGAVYGIRRVLPTGYPSLDLALNQSDLSNQRGFPYGRIIELHGESQAGKSTILNMLAAKNAANGGMTYMLTTEMDLASTRYLSTFMADEGLPEIAEGEDRGHNLSIDHVMTIKDLFDTVKGIIEPLLITADEIEKQGGVPLDVLPPIIITLDSLSALMAGANLANMEKDFDTSDKVGGHAKDLHDFFKFFMGHFARLGIMFIFSNHFRANLSGFGYTKQFPAHDAIVKYYCHSRIGMKRGYNPELTKAVTRMGREKVPGYPIEFKIFKARSEWVENGKVSLNFYYNHGLDYWASLLDALQVAGIVKVKRKAFFFEIPSDPILQEKVGTEPYIEKELKKLLMEDTQLALELEELVFELGPEPLEDMREK